MVLVLEPVHQLLLLFIRQISGSMFIPLFFFLLPLGVLITGLTMITRVLGGLVKVCDTVTSTAYLCQESPQYPSLLGLWVHLCPPLPSVSPLVNHLAQIGVCTFPTSQFTCNCHISSFFTDISILLYNIS